MAKNDQFPTNEGSDLFGELGAALFSPGGLANFPGMGAMASVSRQHQQMTQLQSQQRFAEQIAMNSARTQWLTGQFTQMFTNLPLDQARAKYGWQTDLAQQAAGRFLNSEMASPWFGGSDIDLAFGIQTGVGAAGLQINGSRIFGQGNLNNMISQQLFNDVYKRFADRRGFLRRDLTANFDRTDLGQMFSLLGTQGAFSGLDIGSITATAGGTGFQINEQSSRTITDLIGKTARTFRLLKDIYSDRNFTELAGLAQSLSGASITQLGGQEAIRRSLLSTVTAGEAYGFDPRRALEIHASSVQQLIARGFSPSGAGAFGTALTPMILSAYQNQLGQQQAFSGLGMHMPVQTIGQIGASLTAASAQVMQNTDFGATVTAAQFALESFPLSGDARNRIAALMANPSSPGAVAQLRREVQAATGMSVSRILSLGGGAQNIFGGLSAAGQFNATSAMTAGMAGREMARIQKDFFSPEVLRGLVEGQGVRFVAKDAADVETLMRLQFSAATEAGILGLAKGPGAMDRTALAALIAKDAFGSRMSPEEAQRAMDLLTRHQNALTGMSGWAGRMQALNPHLARYQRTADRLTASMARNVALESFGDMTPDIGGVRRFMAGVLGMDITTDSAAATYIGLMAGMKDPAMEGAIAYFGPNLTQEDADKILRFTPALAKSETAASLMQRARSDPEGTALRIREAMGASGIVNGPANQMRIYDPDMVRRIRESGALKPLSALYAYNALANWDGKDMLKPFNPAEMEKFRAAAFEGNADPADLMSKLVPQINQWAIEENDPAFRQFSTLMDKGTAMAAIDKAIQENRVSRAAMDKKEDQEASDKRLDYLKRKRGELGGDNFIGYLELEGLDKFIVRLVKAVDGGTHNTQ